MSYTIGRNPRVLSLPAMPARFTLAQLQHAFERVLGYRLDKRNFRKQLQVFRLVRPVPGLSTGSRRPAQIYAYSSSRGQRLVIFGPRSKGARSR